ncbi:MAG: single-stranded-DNA-specific exonuclease RecJ [Bacillota bacterium]
MAVTDKFWRIARPEEKLIEKLMASTGYSRLMCSVCVNRGLATADKIKAYTKTYIAEISEFAQLQGIDKAVARIVSAIENEEQIIVYGDYDVDGITSTALIVKVLRELGAKSDKVDFYIPERQAEGYGLNAEALRYLAESRQAKLVITVDCGISGVDEVQGIRGLLDIIITDHHQPPASVPDAYAVINPKMPDCRYPFKQLAGVGVALKLCQALCAHYNKDELWREYLDIVAIGTIADMVPLIGENRIIVKLGLQQIKSSKNIGLKALIAVSGLSNQHEYSADNVGYSLAPRLNAAGRLSQATLSVELFLTADGDRAAEIAEKLNEENIERQKIEREIFLQADELLLRQGKENDRVIVLAGEWNSGVIGIVASRLVAKYYRPVVIISVKDGVGKGSCRSIHSYNIHQALTECRDVLLGFGGHSFAAGLTVAANRIAELSERLNAIAARDLQLSDFFPELEIDTEITVDEISFQNLKELKILEPFGVGNNKPVFALRNINSNSKSASWRLIGKEQRHLKLTVSYKNGKTVDALCWDMADYVSRLGRSNQFSMAVALESNIWRDVERLQLKTNSIIFEAEFVGREILVKIYRKLNALGMNGQELMISRQSLIEKCNDEQPETTISNIEIALKIFQEIGLINYHEQLANYFISKNPAGEQKFDLLKSPTYVFLLRQKELLDSGNCLKV